MNKLTSLKSKLLRFIGISTIKQLNLRLEILLKERKALKEYLEYDKKPSVKVAAAVKKHRKAQINLYTQLLKRYDENVVIMDKIALGKELTKQEKELVLSRPEESEKIIKEYEKSIKDIVVDRAKDDFHWKLRTNEVNITAAISRRRAIYARYAALLVGVIIVACILIDAFILKSQGVGSHLTLIALNTVIVTFTIGMFITAKSKLHDFGEILTFFMTTLSLAYSVVSILLVSKPLFTAYTLAGLSFVMLWGLFAKHVIFSSIDVEDNLEP